jgi:hypothetical protein
VQIAAIVSGFAKIRFSELASSAEEADLTPVLTVYRTIQRFRRFMSHGDFALPAESLTSEVLQEIIESQGIAFYKVDTHTIAALQSLGSQGRNNVTNF